MTTQELAKIKARAQSATPGPFHWVSLGRGTCDSPCITLDGRQATRADQYLFAHAQADISALVAEVERLTNLLSPLPSGEGLASGYVQAEGER